jgi:hypothetical protein
MEINASVDRQTSRIPIRPDRSLTTAAPPRAPPFCSGRNNFVFFVGRTNTRPVEVEINLFGLQVPAGRNEWPP